MGIVCIRYLTYLERAQRKNKKKVIIIIHNLVLLLFVNMLYFLRTLLKSW